MLKTSWLARWPATENFWVAECCALLSSLGSILAICFILYHYNGTPNRKWNNITLNAAVATLTTFSRSMVLLAMASCLGQYKWIWFKEQHRPLPDFEIINEASRGPAGSFRLLLRTVWRVLHLKKTYWRHRASFMWIGCVAIILTSALDPTIQQVVIVENPTWDKSFWTKNGMTQVPVASRWSAATISTTFDGLLKFPPTSWSDVISIQRPRVNYTTLSAIASGLTTSSGEITQQLRLTCGDANCKWDIYQSLAVCSKCNNITSYITSGLMTNTADLAEWFQDPNGVRVGTTIKWFNIPTTPQGTINNPVDYTSSNSTERITMSAQSNWNAGYSVSFRDIPTLINSMAILWADLDKDFKYPDWANTPVQATECALYLCVKEFDTKVEKGTVTETSNETSWTRDRSSYQIIGARQNDYTINQNLLDPDLNKTQRTDLQLVSSSKYLPKGPFSISQGGIGGLIYYINRAFDDGTLWYEGPSEDGKKLERVQVRPGVSGMVRLLPGTHDLQFTPDVMEVLWNNRTLQNLTTLFDNLAASVTNHIRMTADDGATIEGESSSNQGLFRVRWRWITPTVLTQVFAMIFLGVTWWKTNQSSTPLWKSNISSVLFHGLSAHLRREGVNKPLQSEMDEGAKGVIAKLELIDEDGGYCLDGTAGNTHGHMLGSSFDPYMDSVFSDSLLKLIPSPDL